MRGINVFLFYIKEETSARNEGYKYTKNMGIQFKFYNFVVARLFLSTSPLSLSLSLHLSLYSEIQSFTNYTRGVFQLFFGITFRPSCIIFIVFN